MGGGIGLSEGSAVVVVLEGGQGVLGVVDGVLAGCLGVVVAFAFVIHPIGKKSSLAMKNHR